MTKGMTTKVDGSTLLMVIQKRRLKLTFALALCSIVQHGVGRRFDFPGYQKWGLRAIALWGVYGVQKELWVCHSFCLDFDA